MKALLGECQTGNYITSMARASSKQSRKTAILGYGSQGRAVALNLRDSGYQVMIGLPRGSKSKQKAHRDGFTEVGSVNEGVQSAGCICFAFPDHLHGRVFENEIKDSLNDQHTLWFLHGLSVHFRFVKPPAGVDVILIAPHAPGVAVREKFLSDKSLSAFYGIYQDTSGSALKTIFHLTKSLGFKKNRLVETTFEHESLGDLFGEQVVLCGGLAALIKNGFEVLIENGIPPENAYLEVAYQLDQIIQLIKKHGIEGMLKRISVAARLGSLEAGPQIIDSAARKRMQKRFQLIKSGKFARKLDSMSRSEIESLSNQTKNLSHPLLEKATRRFGM